MVDEPLVTGEERVQAWPVAWSAVWVGALSALAVGLVIGLIGYAIGAHELAATRAIDWRSARLGSLIFSIGGAFFAFVVGGWVAARIAGFRRAESAILHGAIAWLVTVPFLMLLGALGAGSAMGGWYGGLAGNVAIPADPAVAAAFRNTALATVAALLLGLVGSAIGGWMASGEPMTLGYYRRREPEARYERRRRAA
jgi:ABC-type Fe3+ transport system permease subunit